MIKLKTNCDDCTHKRICKNINNAEHNMNKLKKTQYGSGPNDDYDWDIMMEHNNVIIEFSCPDFAYEYKPIISDPSPCKDCYVGNTKKSCIGCDKYFDWKERHDD